jgi:hypothetical protein
MEQQAQAVRSANQDAARSGRPLCEQCEEDARNQNPSGDPVGDSNEDVPGATVAPSQTRIITMA